MPWRRLCSARLCRMNGKFFHARSIRPRDFACSATFGAAPYSTGEHKPHIQTSRKTAKISRESYKTLFDCGRGIAAICSACGAFLVQQQEHAMWTAEHRERYKDDRRRYPSDLTDAEWEAIAPYFAVY